MDEVTLDDQLHHTILWNARSDPREVQRWREAATQAIEKRAQHLRCIGAVEEWFQGVDETVRGVASSVNGPLLEELARESHFEDVTCVECFRVGAPLLGPIRSSSDPKKHTYPKGKDAEQLRKECRERNEKLLRTLKEDPHGDYLEKQTMDDAENHWMTPLVPVRDLDLDAVLLGRRFSREQAQRPDGTTKVRAVDDESANGVNPCAEPQGKLCMDSIDYLAASIIAFKTLAGCVPGLWKADIDSAYR